MRRSPDEHRYIFWFVEYDDRGVEHNRIWYIQGLEQIRHAAVPCAKMGEDTELIGENASEADSEGPSLVESVPSPRGRRHPVPLPMTQGRGQQLLPQLLRVLHRKLAGLQWQRKHHPGRSNRGM